MNLVDVIQLNGNDEYWLQLFPSRGIVSDQTYNNQKRKKIKVFIFPDGGMYYLRHCSLIKLPFQWDNEDGKMASRLGHYNMTVADIEYGDWSIFPVVQEKIF